MSRQRLDNESEASDSQSQVLERFSYLASEAKMLARVIEHVPYDEQPPQKPSILELLDRLRVFQVDYLKPLVEKVEEMRDTINYATIQAWEETFKQEQSLEDISRVGEVLDDISRERNQIVSRLEKFDSSHWESTIVQSKGQELLFEEILNRVVEYERTILSRISDQVMVYSQQRNSQREIENRRDQQDDRKG